MLFRLSVFLRVFYATSPNCEEECIKLPPVIVDLSGLFVFLNSLTFSFTYFQHLSLATHNCKMILYTYPSIVKKLYVFLIIMTSSFLSVVMLLAIILCFMLV